MDIQGIPVKRGFGKGFLILLAVVIIATVAAAGYLWLRPKSSANKPKPTKVTLPFNGAAGDEYPNRLEIDLEDSPILHHSQKSLLPIKDIMALPPQFQVSMTIFYTVDGAPVYQGELPDFMSKEEAVGNDGRLKIFKDSAPAREKHLTLVNELVNKFFNSPTEYNQYVKDNFKNVGEPLLFKENEITGLKNIRFDNNPWISTMFITTPGGLKVGSYYSITGKCDYATYKNVNFVFAFTLITDENGKPVQVADTTFNITAE